jgi:quercetin dioxygenase-like cupin family protein
MGARHPVAAMLLAVSAGLVVVPASAQEQTVTRTELMRVPVEGLEGKEGVIYRADFAPGAVAPRHFHPGQEFIYVLEGSLVLERDGMAAQTLKAGETTTQPPHHMHQAKNPSATEPARVLVFMMLGKSEPLAIPAK